MLSFSLLALTRWKLIDFALLKLSSVSFFNIEKEESAVSRWSRARTRAAKVNCFSLQSNYQCRDCLPIVWCRAFIHAWFAGWQGVIKGPKSSKTCLATLARSGKSGRSKIHISLQSLFVIFVGLLAINRLILDIAMVTISISTMTIGSTVKAGSPSSTGAFAESRFLDGF